MVVKAINQLKRRQAAKDDAAKPPDARRTSSLLTEIRDLLATPAATPDVARTMCAVIHHRRRWHRAEVFQTHRRGLA